MGEGIVGFTNRVFTRLSSTQKFVSGNQVLIIYYIIILFFFSLDTYLKHHMYKLKKEKPETITEEMLKLYKLYENHGFIVINILLYGICVGLTIHEEGFNLDYLATITISFLVFTVLMRLFLKLFINEDSYENGMFMRYLNVVCYMILGNFFGFFMPFVKHPNLLIAFTGLVTGLLGCLYIMVQAIFNPEILQRQTDHHERYSEAYGILKGMLGVVVCILALEYLMIYACYTNNPNFYAAGEGRVLNGWDMFYYLIITFTTIGYGDIYPVRYEGMFYSEFTAIVIGLTSMFTTACFIAAVISTANSIAQSNKSKYTSKKNSTILSNKSKSMSKEKKRKSS